MEIQAESCHMQKVKGDKTYDLLFKKSVHPVTVHSVTKIVTGWTEQGNRVGNLKLKSRIP